MKFLRLSLLPLFAIFVFSEASAQIELVDTLTISELVNDHLLGEGVEATNITFNGLSGDSVTVQVMLFRDTTTTGDFNSVVDFEEGIIMASGSVGPLLGQGGGLPEYPVQDDPDLVAIANQAINDAAIIEFDFIVKADSVKFDYVFASNEYPNFTCTQYNDAFGFFLSGPGINGSFTDNAENIALIPNSNVAVAINTVNGGVPTGSGTIENCESANANWIEDSQYFVNNENFEIGDFQVPGLTTTFQAEAAVDICEEYHIKLAIGDASDTALDSYVFLKSGSFQALGEIVADFTPVFASDSSAVTQEGYDSLAIAGCSNPIIELSKPECACFESIEYSFSDESNAILGEDFATVGDFPPPGFDSLGVNEIRVELETLDPTETDTLLIIFLVDFLTCEGIQGQTVVEIPIAPAPEIELTTEDIVLVCPADSTPIQVEANNGILPYIYEWEEFDEPGDFADFSAYWESDFPEEDENFVRQYNVRVRDKCNFKESQDSLTLTNNIPPPLQNDINPFTDPTCPNEPVDLSVSVNDGNPPYFYQWADSDNNSYFDQPFSSIVVDSINPVAIAFTPELEVFSIVTDSCGTVVTDSVIIDYPLPDTLSANFGPLLDNCPDGPVELDADVIGGSGDYTYTWEIGYERFNDFPTDNRPVTGFTDGFGPNMQKTYIDAQSGFNTIRLIVEDRCHRLGYSLEYFPEDVGGGELEFFSLGKDTASTTVPIINISNLPNVITPNGDGQNDVFIVPGINEFESASVLIYDRWGKLIYENNSYDAGSLNSTTSQGFSAEGYNDGTYFYIVNVNSGECVQQGNLQVLGGSE